MKKRKALASLTRRIKSYEVTDADGRIESKGRKRPGSMNGRK